MRSRPSASATRVSSNSCSRVSITTSPADYEQAIHVWTRVLFLDRGHARARAYIERARSALAERQRAVRRTAASRHGGLRGRPGRRGASPADGGRRAGRLVRSGAGVPRAAGSALAVASLPTPTLRAPAPGRRRRRFASRRQRRAGVALAGLVSARRGGGRRRWWRLGSPAPSVNWRGWGAARRPPPSRPAPSHAEPLPTVRASDVALARARSPLRDGSRRATPCACWRRSRWPIRTAPRPIVCWPTSSARCWRSADPSSAEHVSPVR